MDMLRSNIMHAGGHIAGFRYTNSVESVTKSIANAERLIELDCVKIRNGYVLAHDGTESKFYAYDGRFEEIELEHYRKLRVYGRFLPLDFEALDEIVQATPSVTFVLDAKVETERYRSLCSWLSGRFPRLAASLCLQVYSDEDAAVAAAHGINKCVIALWKYFDHDPLGRQALEFVDQAARHGMDVLGVSLRYQNPMTKLVNIDDPRIRDLKGRGYKIYVHGQEGTLRLEQQVRLNIDYGFFSHFSWAELPADFEWREYTAMYPDLAQFDELKAKCHYLEFGQFEGRKCKFQSPRDFDWRSYARLNRDLDLKSELQARAHYTNCGGGEGRKYADVPLNMGAGKGRASI